MGKTQKSLLSGIGVLSLAGIIVKMLGVVYSIPLTWLIGADGLGLFQTVFPTYNLLLTLSSAGLPVAVSRMVSTYLAKDDPRNGKRVLKAALWMLSAIGLLCTVIMLAGNRVLVQLVNEEQVSLGFAVIAPCIALVCAMSAIRGFMQGQQNMVPTAISQLIEQVGKIIISLPLAYLGNRISVAHGAAGALLGITCAEALALLYMIWQYFRKRAAYAQLPQLTGAPEAGSKALMSELVRIAFPITIGACIVPLAQFVDSVMLVERMVASGMAREAARPIYGLFSGLVIRLINVPTALALAVAMSIVPAVSAARAVNDDQAVARHCDTGIRFAFIIGFPCSIGMSVLAHQVVSFFYAERLTAEHLAISGNLLTMSSLTVVLFTVVQATSGILQGLNKQRIPMYTLVAGVGCKILMNYILVGTPGIGIYGGPLASIVCYSVSMIPNLYYVCKYGKVKFNWESWVLRPALATLIMGVVVWTMRSILPTNRLLTIIEVMVGVVVYAAAAVAVKAVDRNEIRSVLRRRRKA